MKYFTLTQTTNKNRFGDGVYWNSISSHYYFLNFFFFSCLAFSFNGYWMDIPFFICSFQSLWKFSLGLQCEGSYKRYLYTTKRKLAQDNKKFQHRILKRKKKQKTLNNKRKNFPPLMWFTNSELPENKASKQCHKVTFTDETGPKTKTIFFVCCWEEGWNSGPAS